MAVKRKHPYKDGSITATPLPPGAKDGPRAHKLPKNRATHTQRLGMMAVQVKTAQDLLMTEIRRAHNEGMSLRAIADAAGISHEQVRRIVSVDR